MSRSLKLQSLALLSCVACAEATPYDAPDASQRQPSPATPEALQPLRRALSRSAVGLVSERRADGISQVRLSGGFQSASILVRDSGGHVQRQCVDDPATLDRLVEQTR
jgi:hypothetical protein